MSNIIIECRNKEAINPPSNGSWTTILKHNIQLDEGDQVVIKDSYIDTQQASSSKVLIENDLQLEFSFGFYQQNIEGLQTMYRNYNNTGGVPEADFENYALCRESPPLTANDSIIQSIVLQTISKSVNFNGGIITLGYEKTAGDGGGGGQRVARIEEILGVNQTGAVVSAWQNIIYDNRFSLVFTPPLESLNLKIASIENFQSTGRVVYEPYITHKNIRIKAGNYDPDEICVKINQEMTRNSVFASFYPTEANQIMATSNQIQRNNIGKTFGLCKAESGDIDPMKILPMLTYPDIAEGDHDIFFGSSQFEIEFDQPSSSFLIKYTHTPLYHTTTLSIGLFQKSGAVSDLYNVNKLGGIFFTDLKSKDLVTGLYTDFWDVQLGFNLGDLLVNWSYGDYTTVVGATDIVLPSELNLQEKLTITGQQGVLDSAVNKTTPQFVELPVYGTPLYATADPSKTLSIFSNKNKSVDSINKFGYYLIEINSQFKNNFLTEDNNYNHMSQIVNRYYELNSYTSGESGQIVYEHFGKSVLLQSFECRILTSTKEPAPNLGDDNTVHLQIIKPPRPSPFQIQLTSKNEKEKEKEKPK